MRRSDTPAARLAETPSGVRDRVAPYAPMMASQNENTEDEHMQVELRDLKIAKWKKRDVP